MKRRMKMNNNNHGGGFINGFLWGAIIGALVVFLLGTKKGKNILKLISEESLELSELFGEDDQEVHRKEKPVRQAETAEVPSDPETENGEVKPVSSPKRFFRGIPKKS